MSNDDDDDIGPLVLEEESVSGEAGSVSEGAGSVFEEAESATDARWQLTAEFSNKNDLKDYIQLYSHKMTATHGKQKSKCNKHTDGHFQHYGYLRCSSVKCIKVPGDCCTFVFKVFYFAQ